MTGNSGEGMLGIGSTTIPYNKLYTDDIIQENSHINPYATMYSIAWIHVDLGIYC